MRNQVLLAAISQYSFVNRIEADVEVFSKI